ncbi:hypothetical protein Q7P37_003027 [Cladosporium fusiforme]
MYSLLQCLGRWSKSTGTIRTPEDDTAEAANSFVDTVFVSEKNGVELRLALDEIIRTNGWKQDFARAVFEALQTAIETARPMGDALREIYDEVILVVNDIEGFVRGHPILCALIALGILVLLSPWVIEALGFIEGGILEADSFAAWWQSKYAGFVPKGSLFSLLQRLASIAIRYTTVATKPGVLNDGKTPNRQSDESANKTKFVSDVH